MTGVSAFLFFFHKHTIITIKDATLIHNHLSQSFTSMVAGTQTLPKTKRNDVPTYPEPEGDPSY